jgi:single-strand DNA-binding protein
LGINPEIRYTKDGLAVAILSLATNEKNGSAFETQWHRIIAIGKLAEICERYLKKGRQICIEGQFQTRSWKKDGNTLSTTEVIASSMEMLGSKHTHPEISDDHIIASQSLESNYIDDDIPF